MYKIQKILLFLAHLYVSFIFRKKEVFVVAGLRRSGNHAFINWFTNALENNPAGYADLTWNVFQTQTGKTIFFNEVNYFGIMAFITSIRSFKSSIKKSSFVIISLEDYTPKKIDEYIPCNAKKISITRSTLNLIASRLQKALNDSKIGLSRRDMTIDRNFFDRVNWHQKAEKLGWEGWNYDSWVKNDSDYRKNFLSKFSLSCDIAPEISKHGGGSSFSGIEKIPNNVEVISRWKNVDWPERILKALIEEEHIQILSSDERVFIEEKLSPPPRK